MESNNDKSKLENRKHEEISYQREAHSELIATFVAWQFSFVADSDCYHRRRNEIIISDKDALFFW